MKQAHPEWRRGFSPAINHPQKSRARRFIFSLAST
jgi:hypothetical protein